jgi:hypothetical protein
MTLTGFVLIYSVSACRLRPQKGSHALRTFTTEKRRRG